MEVAVEAPAVLLLSLAPDDASASPPSPPPLSASVGAAAPVSPPAAVAASAPAVLLLLRRLQQRLRLHERRRHNRLAVALPKVLHPLLAEQQGDAAVPEGCERAMESQDLLFKRRVAEVLSDGEKR